MATDNDKAVLNAIFNPLNPHSDPEELEAESNDDQEEVSQEVKRLELEGVRAAEAQDWSQALNAFNRCVELDSGYASAYNNRAQLRRLMQTSSTVDLINAQNLDSTLEDLETAIRLSGGRGKVGRQALCQRALIQRLKGKEDAALGDFSAAAQLGSKFAKDQLVELNPYAALCNKMLKDMLNKVRTGAPQQ